MSERAAQNKGAGRRCEIKINGGKKEQRPFYGPPRACAYACVSRRDSNGRASRTDRDFTRAKPIGRSAVAAAYLHFWRERGDCALVPSDPLMREFFSYSCYRCLVMALDFAPLMAPGWQVCTEKKCVSSSSALIEKDAFYTIQAKQMIFSSFMVQLLVHACTSPRPSSLATFLNNFYQMAIRVL